MDDPGQIHEDNSTAGYADYPDLARLDMQFETPQLRGFGDLIGRSVRMLGDNIVVVCSLLLLVVAPFDIVIAWGTTAAMQQQDMGVLNPVMSLAQAAAICLAIPALAYAMIIKARDKRSVSIGEALRWGRRVWLLMIAYRILVALIIGIGFILLIVPGIIFLAMFALTDVIVAVEGKHNQGVLERSRFLTRGRRWWILGAYLLATLLTFAFGAGIGVVEALIWQTPGGSAAPIPVVFAAECVFNLVGTFFIGVYLAIDVTIYLDRVGLHLMECPRCAYNLTGNTTGACPECGWSVPERIQDLIAERIAAAEFQEVGDEAPDRRP